jgi:hypothetical protein
MWTFFNVIVFAAGYVASIYTWPWLRTKFIGAEAEVQSLRARASSIKAAL